MHLKRTNQQFLRYHDWQRAPKMFQERTLETKLMKYYKRNIQKEFISDEKLYIFIKNSNALKYNPYIIQLIICHVN